MWKFKGIDVRGEEDVSRRGDVVLIDDGEYFHSYREPITMELSEVRLYMYTRQHCNLVVSLLSLYMIP